MLDAHFEREDALNQRFGTVAAAAWNAVRGSKKRDSWKTWKSFFEPFRKEKRKGLSHSELLAQARAQVAAVYHK